MADKLTLTVADSADSRWQHDIELCEGTVYHDPSWQDIVAMRGGKPTYFRWSDDAGQTTAIAAGNLRTSSVPILGSHNAVLEFGSTPAVHPDYRHRIAELLHALRNGAYGLGCKRVAMESHMGQSFDVDVRTLGFDAKPRLEFRVALDDVDDALFARFSSHHRRKIRKARRGAMTIERSESEDAVRSLRNLQHGSQARREARGEDMRLGDDAPVVRFMHSIISRGLGRLYLARLDDIVVSGALVSTYRQRAYYVFGGSNADGFGMNAPALLFWEIMRECRNDDFVEFNLGGVPGDADRLESQAHGLYRFKSGFGGTVEHRADWSATLRPFVSIAARVAARLLRRA